MLLFLLHPICLLLRYPNCLFLLLLQHPSCRLLLLLLPLQLLRHHGTYRR
jgi:hypothetical protein